MRRRARRSNVLGLAKVISIGLMPGALLGELLVLGALTQVVDDRRTVGSARMSGRSPMGAVPAQLDYSMITSR